MKVCKNCSAEFEPKNERRGHEQLYCTIKCRNEAYKKRVNERQETKNESVGNLERRNDGVLQLRSDGYSDVIGLLKELGEAKAEIVRYQLKSEHLEKENEHLKVKVNQLESELEMIEEEEDDTDSGDMIGGIMTNFKKDPVNTINFASALIKEFFQKQTTNAKAPTTQKSS